MCKDVINLGNTVIYSCFKCIRGKYSEVMYLTEEQLDEIVDIDINMSGEIIQCSLSRRYLLDHCIGPRSRFF